MKTTPASPLRFACPPSHGRAGGVTRARCRSSSGRDALKGRSDAGIFLCPRADELRCWRSAERTAGRESELGAALVSVATGGGGGGLFTALRCRSITDCLMVYISAVSSAVISCWLLPEVQRKMLMPLSDRKINLSFGFTDSEKVF